MKTDFMLILVSQRHLALSSMTKNILFFIAERDSFCVKICRYIPKLILNLKMQNIMCEVSWFVWVVELLVFLSENFKKVLN